MPVATATIKVLSKCGFHLRCFASSSIATTNICRSSKRYLSASASAEGIVSIALNNPHRRNALSTSVLESILEQLETAKADPSTRVIIIKGLGDESQNNGVFCSGHDLKELSQQPGENPASYQQRMEGIFSLCSRVMSEIATFPVPTIAQVDGIATAAGCQLVASTDLAVATASSRFATPGVHIGLFCSTPAVPVLRTVAKKHAMELLLTGEMISAQRAYDMALINRIVEYNSNSDELHQQVQSLASSIASKSSSCIQTGLQTLRAQQSLPLQEAYQVAERTMTQNLLTGDASEGIEAFLNKRKPSW